MDEHARTVVEHMLRAEFLVLDGELRTLDERAWRCRERLGEVIGALEAYGFEVPAGSAVLDGRVKPREQDTPSPADVLRGGG